MFASFLYKIEKNSKNKFMKKKEFKYKMLIGFFSGIVSGLFASGGGMILVPSFMYLLKMEDVESRATSVVCILLMVVTSGIFYYTSDYMDWRIGMLCAVGGIVGGIVGARLLNELPEKYLKIAFTIFLVYAAYKMIWS